MSTAVLLSSDDKISMVTGVRSFSSLPSLISKQPALKFVDDFALKRVPSLSFEVLLCCSCEFLPKCLVVWTK